jgi:hypothetical protein
MGESSGTPGRIRPGFSWLLQLGGATGRSCAKSGSGAAVNSRGWLIIFAPNGRRQLHDAKIKHLVEPFNAEVLEIYSMACGWVLHAKTSTIFATITGYLDSGKFALECADQAERDYVALKAAVRIGKITVCRE